MEINKDQYLSKFTVYKPETLFRTSEKTEDFEDKVIAEALKQKRCGICGNKLKFTRDRRHAYCRSPKHKKSFYINAEKIK